METADDKGSAIREKVAGHGDNQPDGEDCAKEEILTDKSRREPQPPVKRLARSERKRKHYEELLEKRRADRKLRRQERKLRMKEQTSNDGEQTRKGGEQHSEGRKSKLEEKEEMRRRCEEAFITGQKICIDCGLNEYMSDKEMGKLAMQVGRLYGSNKRATTPAHIYLTGLTQGGQLHQHMVKKNDGFTKYLIDCHESSYTELFPVDKMVYLSPDSDNLLTDIDPNKIYIIGGLVDEGVKKNVSLTTADKHGITTARLPIEEHMERKLQATYSKVLAVNQVFDILLTYLGTKCWKKALLAGVPQRKGFVMKESRNDT